MKNLGSALVFRLWPWKVDQPLGDADPACWRENQWWGQGHASRANDERKNDVAPFDQSTPSMNSLSHCFS
jgi:hypothetical protein